MFSFGSNYMIYAVRGYFEVISAQSHVGPFFIKDANLLNYSPIFVLVYFCHPKFFTQFMSAGGVKFEDGNAQDKERPYLRKARVVRWLVVLAAVWTVFRFVSL